METKLRSYQQISTRIELTKPTPLPLYKPLLKLSSSASNSLSLSLSKPWDRSPVAVAPIASMATSAAGASICMKSASCSLKKTQAPTRLSSLRLISLPISGKNFLSLRSSKLPFHHQVCCAAKPETVGKVCQIVKKQLALPDDSEVTAESKFAALGADSLDTVEIVMGLEEEFGISVEEESAQSILTVQDAADLIEKLIEKKGH